ncbi:MAG TPA: hypothetical protein VL856_09735 [Acidimicrobiia bacterium]|nr:hypothetical protein [Acidimicrobiia bacterium]
MTKGAIETGLSFVHAFAAKDHDALRRVLATDVDFRALTPNMDWHEESAATFLANVYSEWYSDHDHIEELIEVSARPIAGSRFHLSYSLHVRNPDGLHLVHQDAYFESEDGQITWLRIACAGYLPV